MNLRKISLALLFAALGTLTVQAQNTNPPSPSTQVWVRETVLGLSEGVMYGTTINNSGQSIAFTSVLTESNDTLYTIANPNSASPSLWMTNGNFQSNTNFPAFPASRTRFTEITGYSHGIYVGNYALSNGTVAFLFSNTPSHSLISYSFPAAKPGTTLFTGIWNGVTVGNYTDFSNKVHGFTYNCTNKVYSSFDYPSAIGRTHINGISEGAIYGSFVTTNGMTLGFTCKNAAFLQVNFTPPVSFSEVTGYSQGISAGNFLDSNGVTHGYYSSGTNFEIIDDPRAVGYTRFAAFNKGMLIGSYYATNNFMENFSSTNVLDNHSILITTNVWQTPVSNYPIHATNPPASKYIPASPSTYQPPADGLTGENVMFGNTGAGVVDTNTLTLTNTATLAGSGTTSLSGSNSYAGSGSVLSGTLTLAGSNNATIANGNNGVGTLTLGNTGLLNTNGTVGLVAATNALTPTNPGRILTGSGALTLSGSNTYAGSGSVLAGTLTSSSAYGGNVTLTSGTIGLVITNGNAGITLVAGSTMSVASYSNFPTIPINGLVFTPDTNTGSLSISNASSNDYTLGNFGCSNFVEISPGDNDTISYADHIGTNPAISLTLWQKATSNPFLGLPNTTNSARLILPDSNEIEFLLP